MNLQQSRDNPNLSNNYLSVLDTDTLLKIFKEMNIENDNLLKGSGVKSLRNEKMIEDIRVELIKRNYVQTLVKNLQELDEEWDSADSNNHYKQQEVLKKMELEVKKLEDIGFDRQGNRLITTQISKVKEKVSEKLNDQLTLNLS